MNGATRVGPGDLPGVRMLRGYPRAQLPRDLFAALAVSALMIPHGMAYAALAGVPAVTGLYTTVAAVVVYALIGPSRVLLLGPDSSLAPLIAAAIALVVTDGDPASAVATAGVLAVLTGAFCVLAGLSRLGSLAELLSRPVQLGYLNGLAIVMVASQLAPLFGFEAGGDNVLARLADTASGIADGATIGPSLLLGLGTLVLILVGARRLPRVPAVLVGVIIAIVAVELFDLIDDGVAVVGNVPTGFPTPSLPTVPLDSLPTLVLAAVGLTWVTLTDTTVLSRGFASRLGDQVDPNREIISLGVANAAAGLVQGFPVSASTSRTTTSYASGGRSQLVGLISAVVIVALLAAGTGFVESLPLSVLAAVVIAAAIELFDVSRVAWLARVRRSEFFLCVGTTVGVVALGVLNGIVLAVVLSLANFVRRVWRPYDALLGRVERRRGYHDVGRHPEARQIPGLLLFRFDAPLFFANADHFARRIEELLDTADAAGDPVRRIVIAAEPITDVDTTAATMLEALVERLDERGVELAFAELKGPVKDRLVAYGMEDRVVAMMDPTVGKAVSRHIRDHDVDWADWTDD